MEDEIQPKEEGPPVIWYMLGAIVISFFIMWVDIAFSAAMRWIVSLAFSLFFAFLFTWIRGWVSYESAVYTVIDLIMRLFWFFAAAIFLFGTVGSAFTVLGVFLSSTADPGGYSGRYIDPY